MIENTPFDHQKHVDMLEKAARQLDSDGHEDLAAAVRSARALHFEFQSRIATAKRTTEQMHVAAQRMESLARTMEEYVTKPAAPWIGVDLFPKELK